MLRELHKELGIDADYGADTGLESFDEAVELVDVGPNLVGHMQRLTPAAAGHWANMVAAQENCRGPAHCQHSRGQCGPGI